MISMIAGQLYYVLEVVRIMFDKRRLYPLWCLTIALAIVFIVGLNWWRVEQVAPEFSSTGRAIYISALIGAVICIVVSVVLRKYFESVSEEQYKLKSMISALEKKIEERK